MAPARELAPTYPHDRSADPIACHEWAATWRNYNGPGAIEESTIRFPTGSHTLPKTLVLQDPSDVAAVAPDMEEIWQRCQHRIADIERRFPDAQLDGMITSLTDLTDADYACLCAAGQWLRNNPTSNLLLRQLPIEGLHTKWLAKHARLVLALLGTKMPDTDDAVSLNPDADTDADASAGVTARMRLHQRLGLRVPPELIQVAVLDPQLRHQIGEMRHFAASIGDLNGWQRHPDTVLIMENKNTAYASDTDHPGTVILHGQGFSVAAYARITWVRNAHRVIYWGDIDLPGLHFLNDLRAHGIDAISILTDRATLERFHHLTVEGATTIRKSVPYLTTTERELYQHLAELAEAGGNGLLLEQERIDWDHGREALLAMMQT